MSGKADDLNKVSGLVNGFVPTSISSFDKGAMVLSVLKH